MSFDEDTQSPETPPEEEGSEQDQNNGSNTPSGKKGKQSSKPSNKGTSGKGRDTKGQGKPGTGGSKSPRGGGSPGSPGKGEVKGGQGGGGIINKARGAVQGNNPIQNPTQLKQQLEQAPEQLAKQAVKQVAKKVLMRIAPYIIAILFVILIILLILWIIASILTCVKKAMGSNPFSGLFNAIKIVFNSYDCQDDSNNSADSNAVVDLTKEGPDAVDNPSGGKPDMKYKISFGFGGSADDIIVTDFIPEGTSFVSASGVYKELKVGDKIIAIQWSATDNGIAITGNAGNPGGTAQKCTDANYNTMAQSVLANPYLQLKGNAAQEKGDIQNHLIKCNTLAMIASLLTLNVPIPITALKTDHDVDGGFHPKGMAMDLGYAAGDATGTKVYEFLYTKRQELGTLQIIWAYPPDISGIDPNQKCLGQTSNAGPWNAAGEPKNCDAFYTVGTMSQHANHIHLAVADM